MGPQLQGDEDPGVGLFFFWFVVEPNKGDKDCVENENEETGDSQANVARVEECDDGVDVSIDVSKWENGADNNGYDDGGDGFLVDVFQASDLK